MAELSERLIRDTIRIIDSERKLQLTIYEVRQLCFAWLRLHGHWKPEQGPTTTSHGDSNG